MLEIGVGTGANLPYYPPAVEVVGIKPDPFMLRRARQKLAEIADRQIELRQASAEELPFVDHTFDHVVSTLVLCTVPDPDRALSEIQRVLKPGGRLHFMEHVRGEGRLGSIQDLARPVWKYFGAGCILNRRTGEIIERTGFHVERLRTEKGEFGIPYLIGTARRRDHSIMRRVLNRRAAILAGALSVLSLSLAGYVGVGRDEARGLEVFGDAPPFALTDHLERAVSSAEFRGEVVVANFIYTSCRDICPFLSVQMHTLQERLRAEGLLGARVQLLSFTVDPERDTPAVLRDYAERHDADPGAWRFLTGLPNTLVPLIVDGFHLGVQVLPPEPGHGGDGDDGSALDSYQVMHSVRFVLIDRRGRIRAYYDARDLDFSQVLRDIRRLLR